MFGKSKMRIGLLALFVVLSMVALTGVAFADGPNRFSQGQEIETYVIYNIYPAVPGTPGLETNVSTSTIVPQYCRILGYSIRTYNTSLSSEGWIGLYDYSDKNVTYIFDEAELETSEFEIVRWYPYPKRISTQLTVTQGANTIVVIYYEDTRKF